MNKQADEKTPAPSTTEQDKTKQPLSEVERAEADLRKGKLGDHLPGSADRLQG